MKIPSRITHFLGRWFFPALLLVGVAHAGAAPEHAIRVRSSYRDAGSGQWTRSVNWRFDQSTAGQTRILREGEEDPLVVIHKNKKGNPVKIERRLLGSDSHREISAVDGPVLLSEGHPAPYDFLAPKTNTLNRVSIKKRAGGMVFAEKAARTKTDFSLKDAMAGGMIAPEWGDTPRLPSRLVLIEIRATENDPPMVRQLWFEGDRLWVYEETPERKSWRLP